MLTEILKLYDENIKLAENLYINDMECFPYHIIKSISIEMLNKQNINVLELDNFIQDTNNNVRYLCFDFKNIISFYNNQLTYKAIKYLLSDTYHDLANLE